MLQKMLCRKWKKIRQQKSSSDAYTAGVNAYIASLTESELPIEYKLLDYKPEAWSNLKIALIYKTNDKRSCRF
jgi:acyl-homoserine lactone acylase PvdQ